MNYTIDFLQNQGFMLILLHIDWHSLDNKEISEAPDFKETFPPHCIAGKPGSERVGYLGKLPIEYVQIDKMDTELFLLDDSIKAIRNPEKYPANGGYGTQRCWVEFA